MAHKSKAEQRLSKIDRQIAHMSRLEQIVTQVKRILMSRSDKQKKLSKKEKLRRNKNGNSKEQKKLIPSGKQRNLVLFAQEMSLIGRHNLSLTLCPSTSPFLLSLILNTGPGRVSTSARSRPTISTTCVPLNSFVYLKACLRRLFNF